MRRRNSAKKNDRLFKQAFHRPAVTRDPKFRPAHLDLTDEQIDRLYFTLSERDRRRLKAEAKEDRERQAIKAMLAREAAAEVQT